MVLADPGGMQAELFGIDRLGDDLLTNSFGVRVLFAIGVVAEREIAELHTVNPR